MQIRSRTIDLRPWISALLILISGLGFAGCDDDGGEGSGGAGAAGAGGGAGGSGGAGATGGGVGGAGGGAAGAGGSGGVAGASCVGDEGCPAGAGCDTDAGECRAQCAMDLECGPREICAPTGLCQPLPACGEDGACAEGSVCNCRGVCEPLLGAPCQRDLQCPVDAYCDPCAGQCMPRVQPCGRCPDTAQGSAGMAAYNPCERRTDVCYPVGAGGLTHCLRGCEAQGACDQLGPGFSCEEIEPGVRACVPRGGECSQPGDCASDADCGEGRFCNDQLYCQRGCGGDAECPNGQICQNLRCLPPCAGPADCPEGAECLEDGRCRIPGGCLSSAECLEPETYCDTDTSMCVPGCERDNDCLDATKTCQDGTCVERGCVANYQCAFGQVCDQPTAQCVEAPGVHCQPDCDPNDESACGGMPRRCLSLQDEEENPIGDYCFEPCGEAPNECPQGYSCVELADQDGNVEAELCVRRCDRNPVSSEK